MSILLSRGDLSTSARGRSALMLDDTEANDIRLFAVDCVEQLRTGRKLGQLQMLQIQLDQAVARLESRNARAVTTARRNRNELVWVERGAKGAV